jgi:hypothetical protein
VRGFAILMLLSRDAVSLAVFTVGKALLEAGLRVEQSSAVGITCGRAAAVIHGIMNPFY